jgi:hypothetical protein
MGTAPTFESSCTGKPDVVSPAADRMRATLSFASVALMALGVP